MEAVTKTDQANCMKSKICFVVVAAVLACTTLFFSCTKEGAGASTGKGGSLTRFTIAGDYLYAVDNHFLYAYSLINPVKPEKVYTSPLNFDIETIYPYKNNLFLG